MKQSKFCQSCGMPLAMDPNNGGTNADNSKSLEYCSFCYQNGQWTNPQIKSGKDMQNFVKSKLTELGYSKLKAWFFTLMIPSLKRWK